MALNFPDNPSVNDVYRDSTSGFAYQWDGTVWQSYSDSSLGQIQVLDDISGSFNSSTQTFALTSSSTAITPANAQQIRVVLGGVVQDPASDYTVSGSNITFTTPPAGGLSFSGVVFGTAVSINTIVDGSVTPLKLSTGGPSWNTDGDMVITGIGSTALLVNGNARVTGILTVGTASITLDGLSNQINVGTGLTLSSTGITAGIITATSFSGDGSGLSGVGPSGQDVTSVAGITTIDLSAGSVIYFTHDTNTTVAFANTSTTQEITFIRVKDNTDTQRNIIWPSSVRWPEIGFPPILQSSSRDGGAQTFKLITRNSGVTWYAWEEHIFYGTGQYLLAWGRNDNYGQLGQNNKTPYSSPVQVPGTTWSSISGGDVHSLATKTDGTLWAWGYNSNGELGQNNRTTYSSPRQIPGNTWSSIDGGDNNSLATKTDGTLWAWGLNFSGQVGQNNRTSYSSPVQIPGNTWSSINAGYSFALATKTDGTLWSWGYNGNGQLGQNNTTPYSSPVQVPGNTWSSISAGYRHSIATKTDGTLWSWGRNNYGQIGQNNTTYYSSPVQIPGTTWSSVISGDNQSLATKTDGTLWAWGRNNNGALGQNNTTDYSSPVQVPGNTWSSISGSSSHSLATKTDGTLWSWGNCAFGKLGQNNTTPYSSPVQVPGTTWSSISGSGVHSLGLYIVT